MLKTAFAFPDSVQSALVDDDDFGSAYEAVSPAHRALLKTAIARLWDWYGPRKETAGLSSRVWRTGFMSEDRCAPLDFALLLFDGSLPSASWLLACVVPAMACNVPKILAVRVNGAGEFPASVLAGFELAGQELVADMDEQSVVALLDRLATEPGRGLVMDCTGDGVDVPSGLSVFRPVRPVSAKVWLDREDDISLEGLAFAHPGMTFTVYGESGDLSGTHFVRGSHDFSDFLEDSSKVAYVSPAQFGHVAERADLVFGPGHEGAWVWTDLSAESFQHHCIAWTIGD